MAFLTEITSSRPLLLFGAGNMGGILLKRWFQAGLSHNEVIIIDPNGQETVETRLGLGKLQVHTSPVDIKSKYAPRVVIFAVKPKDMAGVVSEVRDISLNNTLFISIAAGIRLKSIEDQLGEDAAIVRCMPNVSSAVGKGVGALVGNAAAKGADKKLAEALFTCLGSVVEMKSEDELDAANALFGSGPAYFFYLVEAMVEAGMKVGLDENVAKKLVRETFSGAGALLESSGETAYALRQKVTSPGGTTEAAMEILGAEDGLMGLMEQAIKRAAARGKELSE